MKDVESQGKTTHGQGFAEYGVDAWSRVGHHVFLTPATIKGGKQALIASWQALAEYRWAGSWYRENYEKPYNAHVEGTLRLYKKGESLFLKSIDFKGDFPSRATSASTTSSPAWNPAPTHSRSAAPAPRRPAATGTPARAPSARENPAPTAGHASTSAPPTPPSPSDTHPAPGH
ncbi:hypothetical protein ACFWWA_39000 [Streptomyces goshikiensis]|uniref:hypothetical protein n=1 Tax=Streptomyces goshikiensis TaxID=1942 RepID=UPI003653FA58